MKIFALIFTALAFATATAPAQVPVVISDRNIKIEKVQVDYVPTPEFQYTGKPKRFETAKWIEIEVEFAVDGIELVDELTLEYTALVNGKLCTAEVTHVNIPKGRSRFSVMFISPRNLERLAFPKQFMQGMVDNVWVIPSKQGVKLTGKAVINKAIPNLPRIPDMLSPKSDTPFHVLWWDRYEAVKPKGR